MQITARSSGDCSAIRVHHLYSPARTPIRLDPAVGIPDPAQGEQDIQRVRPDSHTGVDGLLEGDRQQGAAVCHRDLCKHHDIQSCNLMAIAHHVMLV